MTVFLSILKEEKKGTTIAGKPNVASVEEKTADDEPFIYATKQVLSL